MLLQNPLIREECCRGPPVLCMSDKRTTVLERHASVDHSPVLADDQHADSMVDCGSEGEC